MRHTKETIDYIIGRHFDDRWSYREIARDLGDPFTNCTVAGIIYRNREGRESPNFPGKYASSYKATKVIEVPKTAKVN